MDEFDRLTALRGWTTDAERCRALGIDQAQMSRVRNGGSVPGGLFIHRAIRGLDVPYSVLFDDQPETESVAS